MKNKCWGVIFASLLVFACNNTVNVNNGDNSSSSDTAPELSSSSNASSSSAIASSSSNGSISSSSSASAESSSSSIGGISSNSESSSSVAVSSSSSRFGSSPSSSANVSASSSSSGVSSSSSATVAGSSGSLSYGTRFAPDMHGLTPGATTASVNLNWFSTSDNCSSTSTNDGKTLVRLFNATGGLVGTFTGTAAKGPTGKCVHKATITGLTAATSYKYSVSNNDKDWSYDYIYKTPPSGNVFTFAVVADPQVTCCDKPEQDSNTNPKANPATTAQGWKDIVSRIAAKEATFILCAGDQVDGGITYKEGEYEVFFAPEPLRNIPLTPVIGNHDLHTQYFQHFNMPNMTSSNSNNMYSGLAGNYYYLYNNLLIVAFNTGYSQKSNNIAAAIAEYKKTIEAAKAAHAGKYDWLIVQHHKSTTSISAHSADEDIGFLIEGGLEKLITDQGVDLVIAGHDHIHVRTHLMKWDDTKKYSVRSTDKGAIYLTPTTASGIKYYPPLFILEEGQPNAGPFTENYPMLVNGKRGASELRKAKASDPNTWPLSTDFFVKPSGSNFFPNYTPNYTIFEVQGKTIKSTTYTSQDKVVDTFTIEAKGR